MLNCYEEFSIGRGQKRTKVIIWKMNPRITEVERWKKSSQMKEKKMNGKFNSTT